MHPVDRKFIAVNPNSMGCDRNFKGIALAVMILQAADNKGREVELQSKTLLLNGIKKRVPRERVLQ